MTQNTEVNLPLTPQAITDLMRLLSITAWIRAEQLADLDHMRVLGANDVRELLAPAGTPWRAGLVPPIVLNPQLLVVAKAEGDLRAAQEWWTKLARLSEGIEKPQNPSWWTEHEPKKEA